MDQDHRPGTNDPVAEQPAEGQPHPSHGLFNAMLGKFKGAQAGTPADDAGAVSEELQPVPDEPQAGPAPAAVPPEEPAAEPADIKRHWWHIFAVKAPAPDLPEPSRDENDIMAEEPAEQAVEPHFPGSSAYDTAQEEPTVFSDADVLSAEPVIPEPRLEPQAATRPSFLSRLRKVKDQLFPPAVRPAIDDPQLPEESSEQHQYDPGPPQGGTDDDAAPATMVEIPAPLMPDPEPMADEEPTVTDWSPGMTTPDETGDTASERAEPEVKRESTGLFGRLKFWAKRSAPEPSAGPVPHAETAAGSDSFEPAAIDERPGPYTTAPVEEPAAEAAMVPPLMEETEPAPEATAAAAEPEPEPAAIEAQPEPTAAASDGTEIPKIRVSLLFRVREFFIMAGEWFAGRFAALQQRPRGPIDEVLAAKLDQRRQLDREIAARKRAAAALARKLRRGRYERQEVLTSRGQATRDLATILATMKARAEDVQILEKQSMALQGEIQQAGTRHQQQLREIDDSHLQWESLIQTIAQTKAQLDTVSVELGIKRNDAAQLDQLMESRRRDLDAAVAETARLEGVRKGTEQALQEFQAQIARLDQDRNDKEAYVRQATAEMERVKQVMDEHTHQRDVMEGVLAQLQQDVSTRQNLMQQLLDDGVRVKTETDQRLAQREMLTAAIQELTLEKEQLQQDAARLRDEKTTLEQIHAAVSAQAGRATSELQRLEADCQEREQRVADLAKKQEISGLLEQKIAAMKDEGLSLAKKLDELRSQKDLTEKALNSYRRELATVDTDIAQKKEERQRLAAQAQEVDARIASFKQDIELYNSQKSQLSDVIEGSHQKLQSLEQQIAQKQQEHATADQRLLQVRDALSQAEGEHARLQQAVTDDQRRLDDIAGQHRAFEQQLESGRAEVAQLSDTGKGLVEEIGKNTRAKASLIGQVQELKKIMAATARDNDAMQRQRHELESWIKEAVPFRQQQQSAIEGQLAKVNELQRQAAELSERVAADQARQAALQDDLAHLDQEKALRSQSIEDELARLNQRLAQANGAVQDIEREIQQRSEQRMGTIEAIQKLEEERDLLKQEVSGLAAQADKVRQLQAKADELAKMIAAGQQRLEEMFQESQKLAQDKAGLQQAIKQTEAEHLEARDRQRAFAEEVQQVQHNLESLRQTRDQLQDDLGQQQESRQALAAQVEAVQGELDERQRKLDGVNDELRAIEAEIGSKTANREQLDATIAQLKQQHADLLAQVQAATGDIETQKQLARQQLEALTTDVEQHKKSLADLDKSVKDKGAEEAGLLKRLKMLSTEAAQYQNMVKQRSELSRKIEEQKRVLEDLELQAEKKSGLFT